MMNQLLPKQTERHQRQPGLSVLPSCCRIHLVSRFLHSNVHGLPLTEDFLLLPRSSLSLSLSLLMSVCMCISFSISQSVFQTDTHTHIYTHLYTSFYLFLTQYSNHCLLCSCNLIYFSNIKIVL